MTLSIQFLGGTGTVTGSKYLIEGNNRALVDCGLFQGLKELRLQNSGKISELDPRTLSCIILTHAHLDRTGYLPVLVKNGFSGKIYCTPPTRELTQIIERILEPIFTGETPTMLTRKV